jgi:hypothetical protein
LLGKAVPDGVETKFVAIVTSFPSVQALFDVKTRQLTPEVYTLKAEVIFKRKLPRRAPRRRHPTRRSAAGQRRARRRAQRCRAHRSGGHE